MSFLSSLLNPSSEADQQRSPPDQRRESVASGTLAQSPEQTPVALPQYTPPPPRQHSSPSAHRNGSVAQAHQPEAMQALASLSAGNAPPPTEWNGFATPNDVRRASGEMRPGSSGHNAQFELPPPPATAAGRKMSSPTLDQYHVSSRSPEQRRPSMADNQNAAFTLPPLKHVSPVAEHARRASLAAVVEAYADASLDMPSDSLARDQTATRPEATAPRVPEPSALHVSAASSATHSSTIADPANDHSPGPIKQENLTPLATSPTDARRPSLQSGDMEAKAIASLKSEHSIRNQSPLRESSVPMPSTEDNTADAAPSKKRPVPKKKGTASAPGKKAPPSKKRKIEVARSDTPSSRMSKPIITGSSKGTPANSSPAPSNRSYSAEPNDDQDEEEEGTPDGDDVYCLCRKPDTGTFMIGCDGTCDDWFHGKCVGIEERNKNLIDKYMCPNCTQNGVGKTTWKRICRRPGCRLAARIGKNKNGSGGNGSKYCSDECGVLFFREMTANARGREAAAKSRSSRHRKSSFVETEPSATDDLGARGGLLAAGEVRALLDSSDSLDAFKKLGDGVLSPPATPTSPNNTSAKDAASTDNLTEPDAVALASITERKEEARKRHVLLKDRLKFINLVKQAASRAVAEKELKPKDYCGFDPRLEWSEEIFSVWRASPAAQKAFEFDTLDTESTVNGDGTTAGETGNGDVDEDVFGNVVVCDRKKCARHHEWAKLATDDVRFEMGYNGDRMRALDKEEMAVRERAALRGRNGEGEAVIHGVDGGDKEGGVEGKTEVNDGVDVSVERKEPAVTEAAPAAAIDETGEAMAVDS